MRTFSEFEKYAMHVMTKSTPGTYTMQNFATLVANIFHQRAEIKIDEKKKQVIVELLIDEPEKSFLITRYTNKLIGLMVLIEYLNGLYLTRLYSVQNHQQNRSYIKGTQPENKDVKYVVSMEVTDEAVYNFYQRHWHDFFYVSDELRHIVLDNDFKTDEQKNIDGQLNEARKQTKRAFWSIVIALSALLAAIISIFIR